MFRVLFFVYLAMSRDLKPPFLYHLFSFIRTCVCSTLKDERLMFCLGVIGRSFHSLVRSTTPHDYFPLVSVFQNYLTTSVFAHGMFSRNDTARPYVPVFFSLAPVQMSRRRHYVLCPPCPKSNTVASCSD